MSFRFVGNIDSESTYKGFLHKIEDKNKKDEWCEVVQSNGLTIYEQKTYIDVTLLCHGENMNHWYNADNLLGRLIQPPKGYESEHRFIDLKEEDILTLFKLTVETDQRDLIIAMQSVIHGFGFIVDKNICLLICEYLF
jgi:hypothetical protein